MLRSHMCMTSVAAASDTSCICAAAWWCIAGNRWMQLQAKHRFRGTVVSIMDSYWSGEKRESTHLSSSWPPLCLTVKLRQLNLVFPLKVSTICSFYTEAVRWLERGSREVCVSAWPKFQRTIKWINFTAAMMDPFVSQTHSSIRGRTLAQSVCPTSLQPAVQHPVVRN